MTSYPNPERIDHRFRGGLVLAGLAAMRTDSPVLDGHRLTPGPAVDERGPSIVMSSADFIRGWSCGWGLMGIFTWFPQVRHPAFTWDRSAAGVAGAGGSYGAGGCGVSTAEVSGLAPPS